MHFTTCVTLFISISLIIANTFSIADQSKIPGWTQENVKKEQK